MLKKQFLTFFTIVFLLLAACTGKSESESSGNSDTGSSGAVSALSSSGASLPAKSILNTVLTVTVSDVESFSYNGNAPYYFGGERGIWAEMGYSAALFSCPKRESIGTYQEKEHALVMKFAEALVRFPVDPDFSEHMTEQTVLPDFDYMSFDLSLSAERYQHLTVFESGDIYLALNDGKGTPAHHYKAADTADYAVLKKEISDIRASLDALPLDYQLDMGIYPNLFKPESTALRLQFENIGAQPVEFSRAFLVEKQENGVWRKLTEKQPMMTTMDMLTVEPRSNQYYAIDLTLFDGGQEPGHYRVTNTCYAGEESQSFTKEYEISADAMDISYPYPPEMTPENQQYYEKYLSAWGFYCPFTRNYTEQDFALDFQPYLLYNSSVFQEGKRTEFDKYGADIPAEVVEATVTRHFPVTAEQFRAKLPKSQNPAEYFDPEKSSYHFEGGYGGGSMSGVVTNARKEGNLLFLSCDWYNMDDSYHFSHTVTIRLGQNENEFYYMENTVTKQANQ